MNNKTLDLTKIKVIRNVAWFDDRPECKHVIASWRAGRDVGSRCEGYGLRNGQPSPGYCPMDGGTCAMEDPNWVFKPGWDGFAEWMGQGHGYISMKRWPRFKRGHLVAYVVSGDCMAPKWCDGDLVVARMGKESFTDGAACVISRRVHGIPVKGRYLKRIDRVGEKLYYITADNPTFEPVLVPAETVNIVAVVQDVDPKAVLDQLAVCHTFDGHGRIVPKLHAVGQANAGTVP